MNVDQIRHAIAPARQSLLNHPVYKKIDSSAALRTFMEFHIFAVWDFMSLLKSLQQQLCCSSLPWLPNSPLIGSRLVNEIVVAEETDDDGQGGYASHFDLYRRAMRRFGANTTKIDQLLERLRGGQQIRWALREAAVPEAVQQFVGHTFDVIESGDLCRIAANFTFGREDLLPDVFQQIVNRLDTEVGGDLAEFKYYLHRHVELDGKEHGPMATRLIEELCGNDEVKWQMATTAAVAALDARLTLWDAISRAIS